MQLPLLALNDAVVFPDSLTPIAITSERSLAVIESMTEIGAADVVIATTTREVGPDESPEPGDVHTFGTLCSIHRLIRIPDGGVRVLVQGVERVKITGWQDTDDIPIVEAVAQPDTGTAPTQELEALSLQLLQIYSEIVESAAYLPDELKVLAANVEDAGELTHLVASSLRIDTADRQRVLATRNVIRRLKIILAIASRELELVKLGARIHGEVAREMDGAQREWYLRRQLDAIRDELGEGEESATAALSEELAAAGLSKDAQVVVDRELRRLERLPEHAAEHSVIRGYLEWIAALPWRATAASPIELSEAAAQLDRDHWGLEVVKDRILDHLAVTKLRGKQAGGTILCLVGPPGVGKTSLGASIAKSLNRPYARLSVGGVRDEAEIRGHRRTYVGAMPGSVLRAVRDAGSRNAVFVVDEIDKLGSDWRGDPSSAMLEVLDPEQNTTYRDHYLDIPFDLSGIVFVCTANREDTIPAALRDRLEIIRIDGYTEAEKLKIAQRHLVPKVLRESGLKRNQLKLEKDVLTTVIEEWTHEAGVRGLQRKLSSLARHAARQVAEGSGSVSISTSDLRDILGPRVRNDQFSLRRSIPGVATGLAVTSVGGEVLPVECVAVDGGGKLTITGHLGTVMEESVRAALSWLRSSGTTSGDCVVSLLQSADLHVHVPAGAVPKDGPSAGIAIVSAIASCALNTPLRTGVAMTGEVTLTGEVLPIGGLRGKVLAAQRAGIYEVILPVDNEDDLRDIPTSVAAKMTFHLVDHASQVLTIVGIDGRGAVNERPARR